MRFGRRRCDLALTYLNYLSNSLVGDDPTKKVTVMYILQTVEPCIMVIVVSINMDNSQFALAFLRKTVHSSQSNRMITPQHYRDGSRFENSGNRLSDLPELCFMGALRKRQEEITKVTNPHTR
ncbi:hypothetical protein AOZ07_01525 [Glutamicibacter halophytocola]|nr:hypothetical protein AOZ07_01525 [Glutamicibacter halophytocola]